MVEYELDNRLIPEKGHEAIIVGAEFDGKRMDRDFDLLRHHLIDAIDNAQVDILKTAGHLGLDTLKVLYEAELVAGNIRYTELMMMEEVLNNHARYEEFWVSTGDLTEAVYGSETVEVI